jgi:DNA-binding response OmpR family regulator
MRLLLVEDESALAAYLKRGLEREGYAADVAGDGETGLWLATEQPYDAIVLDIMLPKLDGLAVCARLRAADNRTPVLMLTARDGDDDIARALDTGADDYLVKPFAFAVLLARIRALLRRGPAGLLPGLEYGDLRLEPSQHRVKVGGIAVEVTATEFCMLSQLLRLPGAVVSKQDFLGACWDWAFDGDPNIVEVYVGRLRRKLATAGALVSIETVRSAGYRLAGGG